MRADRVWTTQPHAEQFLQALLSDALHRVPAAQRFVDALLEGIAVRLRDILDHVAIVDATTEAAARAAGWTDVAGRPGILRNPTGMFPTLLTNAPNVVIGFRAESVATFLRAQEIHTAIAGKAHGPLRLADAFASDGVVFRAVERAGSDDYEVSEVSDDQIRRARIHLQSFRSRRRQFETMLAAFDYTDGLVDAAVRDLGKDWACFLWLRAERDYWESRNMAGRVQKARQDQIGIGWSNQDHHTYDSSRVWFHRTIRILEALGFECRELFYAGHQAGWGSQILEQPVLGAVIFADIDLAPEELSIDFAHERLTALPILKRAGLWCALHGESMLEAGINHLECMYDHKRLREQLAPLGVRFMNPFSDFDHLYQELTEGEWWPVDPARVDALEAAGQITKEQAEDFRLNGAIGSHLENLERNDGFKGFNQPGIDGVLRIIDPRKNLVGT